MVTKPVPGTLEEGGASFQTTHWTVVLQAGQAEADESARKALATFSETYWPPLYTFVRRRGYSPADAQDIVQGFFAHLFERPFPVGGTWLSHNEPSWFGQRHGVINTEQVVSKLTAALTTMLRKAANPE